jgi:serine/threonine protein kinase
VQDEGDSLAEILSVNPDWWNPTTKVKAVVGIALGLRFAHSFRLIHGHLTANDIFFDSDHRVQIADFGMIGLDGGQRMDTGSGYSCISVTSF